MKGGQVPLWPAFFASMGIYLLALGTIVLQNWLFRKRLRWNKDLLFGGANLLLALFLGIYHYYFVGQRVFPEFQSPIAFFSLSLYFLGIYVFHLTAYPYIPAGSRGTCGSGMAYAWMQLRFMIPFILPFLFFSLLLDGVSLFQETNTWLLLAVTGFFFLVMTLFFPPMIQYIWNCGPLRGKELTDRLQRLCERAQFKHAGLKTWTVLNHSYTAGIIGVLPRLRYVMFTQSLIDDLPPESIEAVLAHEIGHSQRKHLFIYPWILFGIIILLGLVSSLIPEKLLWQLEKHYPAMGALGLATVYALVMGVYFRIVFGYFSRLFERQADLHIFKLGIPSEHMVNALDRVAIMTGHSHQHPSWHHYSIQQRIDFLEKAERDRTLIDKHHRRVKWNLLLYTLLAFLGIAVLL